MKIVNKRKIFFVISGIFVLFSVLIWIAWGLKLGIDFTGGSLLEIEYVDSRPAVEQIRQDLADLNLSGLNIQATGEKGYILRFKEIDEDTHQKILSALNNSFSDDGLELDPEARIKDDDILAGNSINIEALDSDSNINIEGIEIVSDNNQQALKVIENRFESIGPSIGKELQSKSIWAILLVSIAIVLYVAWAFRKVSYPVNSWKYGIIAIIALLHDILITVGIFVFLGKYLGLEVNTPFVAALLTILGYSVNDTIVIFDRIRENLHKYEGEFDEIVDKSILETITRSINTALTTEFVLIAILIFGGASIRDFVLTLVIGIFLGTYSSIFIASPLLVVWQKLDWKLKKS